MSITKWLCYTIRAKTTKSADSLIHALMNFSTHQADARNNDGRSDHHAECLHISERDEVNGKKMPSLDLSFPFSGHNHASLRDNLTSAIRNASLQRVSGLGHALHVATHRPQLPCDVFVNGRHERLSGEHNLWPLSPAKSFRV